MQDFDNITTDGTIQIVISFTHYTHNSNTRINTVLAMKGWIVFVCSLLVGVNSTAVFENGQCLNPDPWRSNRPGTLAPILPGSNFELGRLKDKLANITILVEALELKPTSEKKAVLVQQLAQATEIDTTLKAAKCLLIDPNMKDPNLEEKYKVQFADIAARTAVLRQQLSSLTARVNAIEI